jgi:hypothetical protein
MRRTNSTQARAADCVFAFFHRHSSSRGVPRAAIALLALLAAAAAAAAQQPPPQLGQPVARNTSRVKSLEEASRRGLIGVSLESGRIKVEVYRVPPNPPSPSGKQEGEQLTIRNSNGEFSIDYVKPGPERRVSIEIGVGSGRVHILQEPEAGGEAAWVEFVQPPSGPLTLAVRDRQSQETIRAASLWHLMIGHTAVCRQHLFPLLRMISSRWDPGKLAEDLEEDLIELARSQEAPDRRRWDSLVAQLGDERYMRREAADRQLRAWGRIVVHYLRQLDPARLDAEQKFRVQRIITALSASEGFDTPEHITSWLAGDPSIWLGLLSRDDESTRRLAYQQVSSLLDRPPAFDPAADEKTRQSQVEQIRLRIEK